MAWGLAEFDAEQRGKKAGYGEGLSDGISQAKIETAKNLLAMKLSVENISKATGLSIEEVNLIYNNLK